MKYAIYFKNYEGLSNEVEEYKGEELIFDSKEDALDWYYDHCDELDEGGDEEYIILPYEK